MGSTLPGIAFAQDTSTVYGRALAAAPVFAVPDTQTPPITHLWPDSIITLTQVSRHWFRSDSGYIRRTMIQPVNPLQASIAPLEAPAWAEVTAPVAPVWRWCSANAPLVSRIGHGGVAQVMDTLPGWVGIADERGSLLGWSQSVHWGSITFNGEHIPLDLVVENHRLTVYYQNRAIAHTLAAYNEHLPVGTFALTHGSMGGVSCCPAPGQLYHGVSWQLHVGDGYDLTSVYWHNRFGESIPGSGIQITPVLGRWLYQTAADGSTITIRHKV